MPLPSNPGSADPAMPRLHHLLVRATGAGRHEIAAMVWGFAYFFCLLSGYYLLRPLRDAMGLVGGANRLQWLFTATFVAMLLLVPVFGAITARWPPRRFVPVVYRFFALNILAFGVLFATGVQEVAVSRVFFVWISVFNLFVVSIFWSVLADNFSNEQGRRLFGFIAAGGTAGALAGPAIAALLAVQFGVAVLTLIAAVLLELAVQCFRGLVSATAGWKTNPGPDVQRGTPEPTPADVRLGGGMFGGVMLILRDRYLLGIVMFLLLHTFASTLLYFEQARIVAAALSDTAERTRLFAVVDFSVSCLTILLQLLVTGRFLKHAGVAAALALLPLAGMLAFAGIALWPTLAMLVAVQTLRRSVDYAIVRPGREVLFTVVGREAKYKAKSVIETVVYRGGDAVSGWISAALTGIGVGFTGIALLFLPLTALWVMLSKRLAAGMEMRKAQGNIE